MCRASASPAKSHSGNGPTTTTAKKDMMALSSSSRSSSKKGDPKPAFEGANFDKNGNCLKHSAVQLAEQVQQDGRVLWKEVKMHCPSCVAETHKSRRVTSLGGSGKVKRGRTVHGMSNPLRAPLRTGRHMDKEFSTPFDDKGRCHHHPNIQMASKKFGGGWNILMSACPKCIEAKYEEEAVETSSRGGGSRSRSRGRSNREDDNESTTSGSTKQSVTSRTKPVTLSGKFDKNGCCTMHPNLQVAKKNLIGRWKEFRACPKCFDPNYDDMADNASVSSRHSKSSHRSTSSRKSTGARSVKSNSSRRGGKKTDRFGALPFDGEGYCHAHPSVRLAKKKALGGWKVLHDMCPDCAQDASSQAGGSVRSKSSRRSSKGTGRYFDDSSASETSSKQSGKSSGSGNRKKKIRVKDMRYEDENGKVGKYSGDVNEDHQPHGDGKMKYKDGSIFEGVWSEGSQAHGKTAKGRSSTSSSKLASSSLSSKNNNGDAKSGGGRKSKSSSSNWARRDPTGKSSSNGGTGSADQPNTASGGSGSSSSGSKKVVRKMKWMDYYGDPGEYSGEVDKSNMPIGKGVMKYDHGLVQEGLWEKGQFVEGSDVNNNADDDVEKKGTTKESSSSKKSSGCAVATAGNEKSSSRRPTSSKASSGKRDP